MCKVLQVSRSGYYSWNKGSDSIKKQQAKELLTVIREIFTEYRGTYGYPRIHRELINRGIACSKNRVARLMRKDGLRAKVKRRFKATTDSKHNLPVAANLVQRNFTPDQPDRVWAGDITCVRTGEGWLYLAVVLDLFSRTVVGWAMNRRMTRHLVMNALTMALKRRHPARGLIHHSDRGSQYASSDFQELLSKYGIRCSMSRKGDCWDNAPVESFIGTLKQELIFHKRYITHAQAKQGIFEYIERFYNRKRLHSTLGYQSPFDYEANYFKLAA
jgi:transposase InsO family protein